MTSLLGAPTVLAESCSYHITTRQVAYSNGQVLRIIANALE